MGVTGFGDTRPAVTSVRVCVNLPQAAGIYSAVASLLNIIFNMSCVISEAYVHYISTIHNQQ